MMLYHIEIEMMSSQTKTERKLSEKQSKDTKKESATRRVKNRKNNPSLKSVTRKFKKDTKKTDNEVSKLKRKNRIFKGDYLSFDDSVFAITPEPEKKTVQQRRGLTVKPDIETSFSVNNSLPWLHSDDENDPVQQRRGLTVKPDIETSFSLNNSLPSAHSDGENHTWNKISSVLLSPEKSKNDSGSSTQNLNDSIYENDYALFDSLIQKQNVRTKQLKLNSIKSTVFDKQTIMYLNSVCSDSGECLAYGREQSVIKKVFSDFIDFRHLKKVKKVGQPSANGFVLNLQYETMNYKANALLKSSLRKSSDNLFFEYLAGLVFINRVNEYFPCFTETYHLFKHESQDTKKLIKHNEPHINEYSSIIKLNNCDDSIIEDVKKCIDDSCNNGENYAILVQYINNPISISTFMKEHENDDLFEHQMLCILYQIYCPLSLLRNEFTHYDLHTDNVLLYKLPEGKFVCIQYINRDTGILTTIKTNYIAKIIDYGRCFFTNLGNDLPSSSNILNDVKQSLLCKMNGINNVGFNFKEPFHSHENHYISGYIKNISHDLRLASIVVKKSRKMRKLFNDRIIYKTNYGTPEEYCRHSYYIYNIVDLCKDLEFLVKRQYPSIGVNDSPIGTIRVFLSKNLNEKMRFEPAH